MNLAPLLAMGVAFIVTRFVTMLVFMQISPMPPGMSRWEWWGTYPSLLLAIIAGMAAFTFFQRRAMRRG